MAFGLVKSISVLDAKMELNWGPRLVTMLSKCGFLVIPAPLRKLQFYDNKMIFWPPCPSIEPHIILPKGVQKTIQNVITKRPQNGPLQDAPRAPPGEAGDQTIAPK